VRRDDATDEALVRQIRRGSRRAAGELFDRHWRAMWRVAIAITGSEAIADDVVQDAFLSALAALDRYDPQRPFAPWLRRIVANRATDVWRDERWRAPLDLDLPSAAPAAEDVHDLAAALALLAPERRAAIVLHHLLGYEVGETADMLGVPHGTIASRLHRGLCDLREMLEVQHAG
jgi:RNA polymerase sigma-70 factor (ECF subfamily)